MENAHMRPISKKNRTLINSDIYFTCCARGGSDCSGRITIEHAFIYAGKQLDELWSFVPLCEYHHLGEGLNKRINQFIALNRITEVELKSIQKKYPRFDWYKYKKILTNEKKDQM